MARATKSISGRAGSTSCELDLLLPTSFTVINTSNPHQSPVRQEQFTPPIFQVNAMERILFPQNSYVEVISSSTSEYNCIWGTSLAVQWLRLCASTAVGAGSIPGQGTKSPHAAWCSQKKKKKNTTVFGGYLKR